MFSSRTVWLATCISVIMILLITALARSRDFAHKLREATSESVQVAATLGAAAMQLQAQEFSAVIIDQLLLDTDAEEGEAILRHLGNAVPVYLNFALCGFERMTRELRSALRRRQQEVLVARQDAAQILRGELKDTVTALLLSCEMALQIPNLPLPAEAKMSAVHALARDLRERLGEPEGASP